jgi:hypothetical protein
VPSSGETKPLVKHVTNQVDGQWSMNIDVFFNLCVYSNGDISFHSSTTRGYTTSGRLMTLAARCSLHGMAYLGSGLQPRVSKAWSPDFDVSGPRYPLVNIPKNYGTLGKSPLFIGKSTINGPYFQ